MHYPTTDRAPGMKFDPFKALVVPRPIGWIGTVNRDGVPNLAPYSFFNAVSDRPPMLMSRRGATRTRCATSRTLASSPARSPAGTCARR
jgi:flavin reductase (DIM6/NTAB) family NADH-FMN oxidoreductase RutF